MSLPLRPLANRRRACLATLAPLLVVLALAAAVFAQGGNQRLSAASPGADQPVLQLTCRSVGELIGCKLISSRALAEDEGVRFVLARGAETQLIVATRQTNRVFRSSSSFGQREGQCYVFSFTPEADGGGDLSITEVTPIVSGVEPPTTADTSPTDAGTAEPQPPLRTQAQVEPPQSIPATEGETATVEQTGQKITADQPDAVTAQPVQAQVEPHQSTPATEDQPHTVVARTTPEPVATTDGDLVETPQLSPEEIARRQREHEQRMADAQQELDEVNAEIRKRQEEGDWPERDPDTPEDVLSDAELEAELAVHEELHRQRQAEQEAERQRQRENRFPSHPGEDSEIVVLDFPTENEEGDLPEGAFQEWTVELHALIEAGQPFLVCDHNEVADDGGPLCTWENQ